MDDTAAAVRRAGEEEQTAEMKRRRDELDAVTSTADMLLIRGNSGIYEDRHKALMRQYLRETGDEWIDPPRCSVTDDAWPTSARRLRRRRCARWSHRSYRTSVIAYATPLSDESLKLMGSMARTRETTVAPTGLLRPH
jgi:hypothetical protein